MARIMCGNFEVDTTRGWVRIQYAKDDYEYIVDPENFKYKDDSIKAAKSFIRGYQVSKDVFRKRFKELLNL